MKNFALVLASVGYASALAKPAHANQARAAAIAPHTQNRAPVVNPSYANVAEAPADVDQFCISITSDNDDWYYTNQPPWGTASGTIGSLGGQICLPTNNSAGGAMFIGPDANPSAGSTKFECFLPTSGTGNCDMSLVDGYSLSMTCTVESQTIGGSVDLWTTGTACPDTTLESSGICKNDNSYGSSQGAVDAFFQPAVNNGNQYCIWVNCDQDYYFQVTSSMSCHISGTAES